MFKKILVAYDGSEHSVTAIKTAVSLAEKYGSEVTVITVFDFPAYGFGSGFDSGVIPQQVVDNVEAETRKMLDEVMQEFGTLPVKTILTYGHPANEIIEESKKGYHLLVLGSRGLGEFKGFIMGSVSARVAHYAACPVMIMH